MVGPHRNPHVRRGILIVLFTGLAMMAIAIGGLLLLLWATA